MIKELFNSIKEIVDSHKLIYSFNYGDVFSIQSNGDDLHPQFYLEYPFTITYGNNIKDISFTYTISDIPSEDGSDEIELLNKLEEINENILARIFFNDIYTITNSSSITLNEWEDNKCVAIRTDITLRIERSLNNCLAPMA